MEGEDVEAKLDGRWGQEGLNWQPSQCEFTKEKTHPLCKTGQRQKINCNKPYSATLLAQYQESTPVFQKRGEIYIYLL